MTLFLFLLISRRCLCLGMSQPHFSVVSVYEIVLPVFRRYVWFYFYAFKVFFSGFDALFSDVIPLFLCFFYVYIFNKVVFGFELIFFPL